MRLRHRSEFHGVLRNAEGYVCPLTADWFTSANPLFEPWLAYKYARRKHRKALRWLEEHKPQSLCEVGGGFGIASWLAREHVPEVTGISVRQVPGTRWTRLSMRWCQSGGLGHRVTTHFRSREKSGWHFSRASTRTMRTRCGTYTVEHRHAHRAGSTVTVFADVRDATTGMRYWSTYPTRLRIR